MSSGKHFFEDGFNLPKVEEKVLNFWRTNQIFEKSVALRRQPASAKATAGRRKKFVFFEGPPTANGRPGIHHVLARAFKDIIPRYKTMRGFSVPRKGGWDTHGLPVEIEVEKELGLKSKKDIETFGIAAFNKKCKESVWKYKDEWEKLTERMGYWIDLKNPYVTYENKYIETLWWIIKEAWKKGFLYQGHKVVPWCSRCGTSLSSHELAQGYKESIDQSVYVKFRLLPGRRFGGSGEYATKDSAYILSWTTTPWTLPGNVALAIGKNIRYSGVRIDGAKDLLILAEDLVDTALKGHTIEQVHVYKGVELLGLKYEPLFDVPSLRNENSHKIYPADFVTTKEGTGVVHTAVMYGEDDYELGMKVGLPQHHTVDEMGRFTNEVPGLGGLYVKSKETEEKIFNHLKKNNNLLRTESYTHEYPFCWRCGTPLLYYARTSWFVRMSKLRAQLLKNNKTINWTPEHIKNGRFGEWLKDAKDWNFSRERYWGTPLPVWRCGKCGHDEVLGSIDELQKKALKRNTFFFMRHGEATSNVDNIEAPIEDTPQYTSNLTPRGTQQVEKIARSLKRTKLDLIIASPRVRTRDTAHIVSKATGARVEYSNEIIDMNPGIFAGKKTQEYDAYFNNDETRTFSEPPPQGESRNQVKQRILRFFRTTDSKYEGKTILVVSHADPLWLLRGALDGLNDGEILKLPYPETGKIYKIDCDALPLDEDARLDLHRPYIDAVTIRCGKCKGASRRVKEVIDAWFDSGAMPFAQWHYPFENKQSIDKKLAFPADYIAEGLDQTRGWFYTLLAIATLLKKEAPYKNAISLGLLNDKFGQKMSKSKGNVVDPWTMMEKYGIDAIRWYFYSATPPGEPKNFDEADILKAFRKLHLILYNSFVFWKTYGREKRATVMQSRNFHILDRWVLARLAETVLATTRHLDAYEIREAALIIEGFVDDLSRWYIRRSRRRFQKPENQKDFEQASATLGYVLSETAKLVAPLLPFFSEALYGELRIILAKPAESVHLANWPECQKKIIDKKLIGAMAEVRRLASVGLAKREESKIKIRQPLQTMSVQKKTFAATKELLEILKDEVNVKEIVFNPNLKEEISLDTTITPQLREEGVLRDLTRIVQDLRQKAGYRPQDKIALSVELPNEITGMVSRNEEFFKGEIGAKTIEYKRGTKFDAEIDTKFEHWEIWLAVKKI